MTMKPWHVPVRLSTGAFILNSGLGKRGMPAEGAAGLQGFASTAFPQIGGMDATRFARLLSTSEIVLGAALLIPFVPAAVAGAGLAAFGGGLTWLYYKAPGLRQEGSLKPTEAGTGIAKDVWMLAMGAALVVDEVADPAF